MHSLHADILLAILLLQRHTAAYFLAILAFREGKQDDLALIEASEFNIVGACWKRPKKECRDMLGDTAESWLAGPKHRSCHKQP